ncbi:unnamed protein product [Cunninghamella echinulata]
MLDIPPSFIVSSKLSPLEPTDVLRLLGLAQTRWNDKCVEQSMIRYPSRPILAAGISNPQDLQRVISYGVPVIHLENECQSLQRAQQRSLKELRYIHVIGFFSTASLWGSFSALLVYLPSLHLHNQHHHYHYFHIYRKFIEKLPASIIYGISTMTFVTLTLYTAQFMRSLRYSYNMFIIDKESFLLRNDVLYSNPWFFLKKVVPYCLTATTVFLLCKRKLT